MVAVLAGLLLAGCGGGDPTTDHSTTPLPAHPRVLVFGDSYTVGQGAEPTTLGYAHQLSEKLGWEVTVDGAGGTGYLNPADRGTYLTRLATAAPGPFDVVVLQGSSNDQKHPLTELPPAIDATVSAFRIKYPDARIILMGPVALHNSVPPTKGAVNQTLKDYASSHTLSFVDPIAEAWFAPGESATMVNPADGHPSNEGHLRIRDRLVDDLLRLTKTPAPG